MAEPKTRPTKASVEAFLKKAAATPERLRDCKTIAAMMRKATGAAPQMWGPSIVGFGRCNLGTEQKPSEWPLVGFSPRKPELVVYVMPGFDAYQDLLAKLGPHKTGKSCLYLKRLEGLDVKALQTLIERSVARVREQYPR